MSSGDRQAVSAHFSRTSDAYERYWSAALMPANVQMIERLPMSSARVVLDVGAGVGSLYAAISQAAPAAQVVLSDRSHGMIARAPVAADRIVADADHLPLRDGVADIATLAFMLQYLDSPARTLGEVHRVLRPGGYVGALIWGATSVSRASQFWLDELDAAGAPAPPPLAAYYEAADTVDKLRDALSSAGFSEIEVHDVPWFDQPDVELFLERIRRIGVSGRRLAAWDDASRTAFLERMEPQVRAFDPVDFRNESQVLLGIAQA